MAQSAKCTSVRRYKCFRKHLRVPDRWFDYQPFGEAIAGFKIIAVKTPLKKEFNNGRPQKEGWEFNYHTGVCVEDEFTPQQLVDWLATEKKLKLSSVLDLTYTDRYYDPSEMEDLGVSHTKIKCPGQDVPSDSVYSRFAVALKKCLSFCDKPESVVAVHCTHGVNRTGYLVCRFLMKEKGLSPEAAIAGFNKARGHDIERPHYLEHLRKGCPPLSPQPQHHSSSRDQREEAVSWRGPSPRQEEGATPWREPPHRSGGPPQPQHHSSSRGQREEALSWRGPSHRQEEATTPWRESSHRSGGLQHHSSSRGQREEALSWRGPSHRQEKAATPWREPSHRSGGRGGGYVSERQHWNYHQHRPHYDRHQTSHCHYDQSLYSDRGFPNRR